MYEVEVRGDAFALKDVYGQITLFQRRGGGTRAPWGGP
jgi:hypothetical protein